MGIPQFPGVLSGVDVGQLVTNPGAVQDWTPFTFDGNTDGALALEIQLLNPTGGQVTYAFQPNGLTTNLQRLSIIGFATAAIQDGGVVADGFFAQAAAGANVTVRVTVGVKTGRKRLITCDAIRDDGLSHNTRILWTDTTTNMTSLPIHCSAVGGIGIGSTVAWRKTGFTA